MSLPAADDGPEAGDEHKADGAPTKILVGEDVVRRAESATIAGRAGEAATTKTPVSKTSTRQQSQDEAARNIQRTYRGYRTRRNLQGLHLDAASRWTEAIREAQYRELTEPRRRQSSKSATAGSHSTQDGSASSPVFFGPNRTTTRARSKWELASSIARRANLDEESSLSSSSSSPSQDDDTTSPISPTSSVSRFKASSTFTFHRHSSQGGSAQRRPESRDGRGMKPFKDSRRKSKADMTPEERHARKQRKLAEKQDRVKSAKTMDISYFLEMVDVKHRYGSNLRKYHAEWKARPTNENFFYWLDHGDAKDLDLPKCSRQRLDDMQVRYLNREERSLYEVVVNKQGKLVWRKDDVAVDTTAEWRDSIEGIVKVDDPAPPWADRPAFLRGSSESSGISDEEDDDPEKEEIAYEGKPLADKQGAKDDKDDDSQRKVQDGEDGEKPQSPDGDAESSTGIQRHESILTKLRHPRSIPLHTKDGVDGGSSSSKPSKKPALAGNPKWIFVADTKNNLYIGIKQTGAFQHSSFLHGSRVSVAGLIRVRQGQLRILQPRSGHYRTPSHNLHIFIKSLQNRGVDMHLTAVGGSYAAMVGIEGYMKTKGRWNQLKGGLAKRVGTLKEELGSGNKDGNDRDGDDADDEKGEKTNGPTLEIRD